MNTHTSSRKLFRWLVFATQVVALGGLLALPAHAQDQDQKPTSSDKAPDVVTTSGEAGSTTIAPPAKPAPEPILPPPAGNSWTGVYVGGHLGYGWGGANTSFTPLPTATAFFDMAPTTLRPNPRGVIGGAQLGANLQFGGIWVTGFEFSSSWSKMKGTATVTPITRNNGTTYPGAGFLTAHQDTNWFGTVRPRLGILADPSHRLLVYATGGWAFGHVNYSANSDFRPGGTIQYPAAFSKTKNGWTVGGGVEIAVAPHWGVGGEYLYYNLGNESFTANPSPVNPPFQVAYNWQTRASILSGRINYHF